MADDPQGLSDEERAELEQLRAEKAKRDAAARAQSERAELERLKREQRRVDERAAADERTRKIRERNAKLMEPDDDLRMPLGQKIVLLAVLALVVIIVIAMNLGR